MLFYFKFQSIWSLINDDLKKINIFEFFSFVSLTFLVLAASINPSQAHTAQLQSAL